MMKEKRINVQDSVLNQVRKEKRQVRVVLSNGHEVDGRVEAFDNYTILLKSAGETYLIYKQSICFLSYFG